MVCVASILAIICAVCAGFFNKSKHFDPPVTYDPLTGSSAGLLRSRDRAIGKNLCLAVPVDARSAVRNYKAVELIAQDCKKTLHTKFEFTSLGRMKSFISDMCVDVDDNEEVLVVWKRRVRSVFLSECSNSKTQLWDYGADGEIRNLFSGQCVHLVNQQLRMLSCNSNHGTQHWSWVPAPVNLKTVGFITNVLTHECLTWVEDRLFLSECNYHGADYGQRFLRTELGSVLQLTTGECISIDGRSARASLDACSTKRNNVLLYHDQAIISRKSPSLCLDVHSQAGQLAACSGHSVVLTSCMSAAEAPNLQHWEFISLDAVRPPPDGSSMKFLPTSVVSKVRGVEATLLKPGRRCQSNVKNVGKQRTLQECMLQIDWLRRATKQSPSSPESASTSPSPMYFIYGTRENEAGLCFLQTPSSGDCPEGFAFGNFNYYRLDMKREWGSVPLPFVAQLAQMATRTYYSYGSGNHLVGWTVRHQCEKRKDSIWTKVTPGVTGHASDLLTVFSKGKRCVLAFEGTNDLKDVEVDLEIRTRKLCDAHVHRGFAGELMEFLHTDCWMKDVAPFLAGSQCSDGRIAVGHSMGGSIAALLAYCANRETASRAEGRAASSWLQTLQPDAPSFTVTAVYSWGAPGFATQPLTNGQSADGCFRGRRFFNLDALGRDPVPWVTSVVGLVHPNMEAVWLSEDSLGYVRQTAFKCDSAQVAQLPRSDSYCHLKFADHSMSRYMYRLEQLYGPFANGTYVADDDA
eukprot:TRINITY_DN15160_c0_g1_i2.p1 TRINITY_DN15160_c0_g1~~TRINITY_DN15160_c0_g1_i2.p1  ORF type:complete len:816 (+),score=75.62 TRINITY_DN15160_c0_g1_i2:213-2450(+)